MARFKRASNDDQDQYVLTVFLPLLAIAILACVGGCCYMERRRRRRKKRNGGIDPEELRQQQDADDAASVISTSSSRRRHYLNPTPTTGRLVRGAAVRSNYSSLGEPIYETEKRMRSSTRSRNQYPEWERFDNQYRNEMNVHDLQERPSSRHSSGYGGRPLSRSRSMVDIRSHDDDQERSLRRTRSSNNVGWPSSDMADSGYQDNQSNSETENLYEYLNAKPEKSVEKGPRSQYGRPPSPTRSEYSVRTAPSRTGREDYQFNQIRRSTSRPASVQDFGGQRNRSLMRTMSQPDLARSVDSKTYPQGILKKDPAGDMRRQAGSYYNYSMVRPENQSSSDYGGYYGHRSYHNGQQNTRSSNEDQSSVRASSRPPSVVGYNRNQNYDPYYNRQYSDYQGYSNGYNQPPAYSSNGYHRHHQLPGKYSNGYEQQYGSYNDYWGGYAPNHRMSMY